MPADPGRTLTDFVEAAGAGDAERSWSLLSRPSRARFGPTLAGFRRATAAELVEGVGSFAGGAYELIVSERVSGAWAVAAVAGQRTVEGRSEYGAYAAALRLEGLAWKLELGAPITIRPLVPDPGETLTRTRTQLAAEIKGPGPILEAGAWLDGDPYPVRSGGPNPSMITIFAQIETLRPGRHAAIAFARAGRSATALGWTFVARPEAKP